MGRTPRLPAEDAANGLGCAASATGSVIAAPTLQVKYLPERSSRRTPGAPQTASEHDSLTVPFGYRTSCPTVTATSTRMNNQDTAATSKSVLRLIAVNPGWYQPEYLARLQGSENAGGNVS